ncbi:IS66 family element, transposase domain protein [Leptospira santarosai str. HAI821]|nr:IS66 family element, transposase domain protein [Leptospira santarosai str. HAI821]
MGIIQTDGFESYDSLLKTKSRILHAGCWNHARRRFFEILKIDSKNAQAEWIIMLRPLECNIEFRKSVSFMQSNQKLKKQT